LIYILFTKAQKQVSKDYFVTDIEQYLSLK